MIFQMTASLFLIVAVVCFLHLTPKQIADDVLALTTREPTFAILQDLSERGKREKASESGCCIRKTR